MDNITAADLAQLTGMCTDGQHEGRHYAETRNTVFGDQVAIRCYCGEQTDWVQVFQARQHGYQG